MPNIDPHIARHDERLKTVEQQIEKLDKKIDGLTGDIHEIKVLIANITGRAQGAWWVMAVAGGLAGALVSFAMKILPAMR
jgi:phage shock protein A